MSHLYVHIPFCQSRCIYCNFYSTTNSKLQKQYFDELCCEVEHRQDYLSNRTLKTIYFGGGTPSVIEPTLVEQLIKKIKSIFAFDPNYEFTIEANPGDITTEKLQAWHDFGINRLSLGVQTFNDDQLQFLHRRHNKEQALEAVRKAQENGFTNISIDLIYGLPNQTIDDLKSDLSTAIQLQTQHISTYCLTYEHGTPLELWQKKNHVEQDEDIMNDMTDMLCSELSQHGFEHYEVSNFSLHGYQSKHNSAYWTGDEYLGLGAAAHSFNLKSRQWNENNIENYINRKNKVQVENLTDTEIFNEKIMLGLRTAQGLELNVLTDKQKEHILKKATHFIERQILEITDNHLKISNQDGWHLLDYITVELMTNNTLH